MPGFGILPGQRGQPGQVPKPDTVVYTYTWDVSQLLAKKVSGSPLVYLKTLTPPSYTIDSEDINTGHAEYKIAKGIKWSDVKLSFYDTKGLGKILKTVADTIWTPSTGLKLANDYMADTTINVNYADDTPAYNWVLKNSWLKSVALSELTYESSGIVNVNVTVAYSWAIYTAT